jgi:A/G-specific adenine glycosylase
MERFGLLSSGAKFKKACETILQEYNGNIPLDVETLVTIPGIGPYTANALVAIGADQRGLALDANLERVLARIYGIDTAKGPKLTKHLYELFDQQKILKGQTEYRALNEALMDLGRNLCQANRAQCDLCFLKSKCEAFQQKKSLEYPVNNGVKTSDSIKLNLLRVICIEDGNLLVHKRGAKQWLAGQWELPTFILNNAIELDQYPKLKTSYPIEYLPEYKTAITKYSISNKVLLVDLKEFNDLVGSTKNYSAISGDFKRQNLSTASLKALNFLGI